VTAYKRQVGSIIIFSTPNVTVLGQSLNPLAQLSGSELIARLLEELGGGSGLSITDLEADGQTPVTVFEQDATIEEFTAVSESPPGGTGSTAQFTGNSSSSQGIPIRLYLLSVSHEYSDGNDVVFTLAVQPQAKTTPETIYDLFGALQHPTTPPASANSGQQ
jgi:hypothetical protein